MVAKELRVAPPRVHLPVWPFYAAGLLCEMVCVPLRIEPPIYRRRVDFYTKSRAFDTTRARTELGYSPKVDLEEGIKRTADWYRSEGSPALWIKSARRATEPVRTKITACTAAVAPSTPRLIATALTPARERTIEGSTRPCE